MKSKYKDVCKIRTHKNKYYIELEETRDIINILYPTSTMECEFSHGDYQGEIVEFRSFPDGDPMEEKYLFIQYSYGSCSMCDPYMALTTDLCGWHTLKELKEKINQMDEWIDHFLENNTILFHKSKIAYFLKGNWQLGYMEKEFEIFEHFNIPFTNRYDIDSDVVEDGIDVARWIEIKQAIYLEYSIHNIDIDNDDFITDEKLANKHDIVPYWWHRVKSSLRGNKGKVR